MHGHLLAAYLASNFKKLSTYGREVLELAAGQEKQSRARTVRSEVHVDVQ